MMFDATVTMNIKASIASHLLKVNSSMFYYKSSFSNAPENYFVIEPDKVSISAKFTVSNMTPRI